MTTTPGDEIAYRTTPGGELWHPTGTPQNEATAVASDSIHRQLGASVDDLTARVAAVEAGTSGGAAFTVNAANYTATFTTTTGA